MKKIFFAMSICLSVILNVSAQENNGFNYNLVETASDTITEQGNREYVKVDTIEYLTDQIQDLLFSAHAGLSLSMGENTRFGSTFSAIRPSFKISAGKFFYPQFGLRGSIEYLNQTGRAEWSSAEIIEKEGKYDANYSFSMAALFLDGMVNFHNVFWPYKADRKFNLIGYFGLGFFYTFGFDKAKLDYLRRPIKPDGSLVFPEMAENCYEVDGDSHGYFAGRAGLIFSYQFSKKWDVNLDLSFNGTDDNYNGHAFGRVYDTYVNAMLGVTYHIKDQSRRRRLQYSRYSEPDMVTVLNRQVYDLNDSIDDALTPVVKMEEKVSYNEMMQTTVSFYIDKTFITDAQKRNVRSVAKFMESHPDLDIVVTGYADAQTAYPKYNMMLSKKRAQAVYDMLVNEFNIDPSRLSMEFKGDEEQPFNIVNEWNRAVVFFLKPHQN